MTSSFHESFEKKQNEISFELEGEDERRKQVEEVAVRVPNFWFRLGRQPISLSLVEYRIIQFLANKPYKAYRREQIVDAVSSERHPVTDNDLDEHIRTLRGKLGLFSDYIQTVPYIGFRFKP